MHHLGEELLRLPPGCAVADGRDGHAMFADQLLHRGLGLLHPAMGGQREDHAGVQHPARSVHHGYLAPRADAGIQPDGYLPAHRGLHQQGLQVQREHPNGCRRSPIRQVTPQLRLNGGGNQPGVSVLAGPLYVSGGQAPGVGNIIRLNDALGCGFTDLQLYLQEALLLAPVHGKHPVGGHQLPGLGAVVVHAVDAVLLACGAGGHHAVPAAEGLQLGTHSWIIADLLGNDVHGALQRVLCRGYALFRINIACGQLFCRACLGQLQQQHVRQGRQPLLPGDHGPGAALGPVGAVDVLQLTHGGCLIQRSLQLLCPDLQLLQ